MNDICNMSILLFTIMYADDTSVLLSGKGLSDLSSLLTNELELFYTWLNSNKLFPYTHKTFYHLFHRARSKKHYYFNCTNK